MKLHLPKMLLTAVLAAVTASHTQALSSAPSDESTSTSGDLLWAYSSNSSSENGITNNLPSDATVTNAFTVNDDGTVTANSNKTRVQISDIDSSAATGFTVSLDLCAATVDNWKSLISFSADEGTSQMQLQKDDNGNAMIYIGVAGAVSNGTFNGVTGDGSHSLGKLDSLMGSTLTFTYTGTALSTYIDGILHTTITYAPPASETTRNVGITDITFGKDLLESRGSNVTFNNIGIWQSAMTANEVAATQADLYTLALSGSAVNADEAAWMNQGATVDYSTITSDSRLALSAGEAGGALSLTDNLEVKALYFTGGDVTLQGAKTLSTSGISVRNGATVSIAKNTVLDLSSIELNDATNVGLEKGVVGLINSVSGEGTVKLADVSYINNGSSKTTMTFDTNYVIGSDADAKFSVNTEKSDGSWITHLLTEDGSINVGAGAGTLEFLSGQKLLIQGGSVTAGTLALGHTDNADYSGAVEMQSGRMTVGKIYLQNRGRESWKNEVKLLNGSLKVTGDTAVGYASTACTAVVFGGSGENSLILQTGEKDWSLSKSTTAGSTLEVGNIVVDATNSKKITINDAVLTGHITNNAQLALVGSMDFTSSASAITNTGTLDLSRLSLNVQSVSGLNKTDDFSLSDGENGYITGGGYILVTNSATGTVTSDGLSVNVSGIEMTLTNQNGTISFATSDKVYQVNTTASYDSASMGGMEKFWVNSAGTLNTKDASILGKVVMAADTSKTYFQNAAGTNLLSFAGDMGSVGLELTADGTTVTTADSDKSGFTGNITVLTGTTLKAGHNSGLGTIYKDDNARSITVQNGAFYDVNGTESYYHVILEDGATIKNSGRNIVTDWMSLPYLELKGNATIDNAADSQMLMQKAGADSSSAARKLALGDHTLTKTGAGTFIVYSGITLESNGGTIEVDQGSFKVDSGAGWSGKVNVIVDDGNFWNNKAGATIGSLTVNGGYFRSDQNATVDSMTVGAAANEIFINANTITVTGTTTSEDVLKKTGGGTLTLNGAANLKGINVNNGTLNLNGTTTIRGLITVGTDKTLTIGESGSVKINNLAEFALADGSLPTTNGLVENARYKVLSGTSDSLTAKGITYGSSTLTIDADGCVSSAVYYVVEEGKSVTVSGSEAPEFYVGEKGHMIYSNSFGTTGGNVAFPTITNLTGTGVVSITLAAASGSSNPNHHDNAVSISDAFKGTLAVSGKMNLSSFSLGKDARIQLVSGEHWSDTRSSDLNILLSDTQGSYEFRHSNTLTLNGVISGKYLDVGTVNGAGTLKLTNAANAIEHVALGASNQTANLTVAADMAFSTLTSVNSGSNITLEEGVQLTLGSDSQEATASISTIAKLTTHSAGNTLQLNKSATLDEIGTISGGRLTLSGTGTYLVADKGTSAMNVALDSDTWRGTVAIRNMEGSNGINFDAMGNANSTIKLQGLSGWIDTSHKSIVSDIILENYSQGEVRKSAMVITDHSATEYFFRGGVSGTGDFEFASTATTNDGKFEFSGDMSGWKGGFLVNEASDGSGDTPKITLKLTGGGDIFSAESNRGISLNRAGELEVQIGNGSKSSTINGTITNTSTGTLAVKVNEGAQDVTFNKKVDISGTFTVDGNTVTLTQAGNSVGNLDVSRGMQTTGTLEISSGATLDVKERMWLNKSINVNDTAGLTMGVLTVTGRGDNSSMGGNTSSADEYTLSSGKHTISNADVTIASDTNQTIGNVLNNSSLINDGGTVQTSTGKVTATNSANQFVDIKAITGSIELMNLTNGAELKDLQVDEAKQVGAYTGADSGAAKAAVSVSGQATFGAGAVLSANLTLASGSELVSVGDADGISLNGGALTLTLGGNIDLGDDLRGRIDSLTPGGTLVLFSDVSGLTLNPAPEAVALLSTRSADTTTETDASAVFGELAPGEYIINLAQNQVLITALPIPEPTTATLSLLALAGLAARRRRK